MIANLKSGRCAVPNFLEIFAKEVGMRVQVAYVGIVYLLLSLNVARLKVLANVLPRAI